MSYQREIHLPRGDTLHGEIHFPRGDTLSTGRYTFHGRYTYHGVIHLPRGDTLPCFWPTTYLYFSIHHNPVATKSRTRKVEYILVDRKQNYFGEAIKERILIHEGIWRQYFIGNIIWTACRWPGWPPEFPSGWPVITHNSQGFTYLV